MDSHSILLKFYFSLAFFTVIILKLICIAICVTSSFLFIAE